MTKRKASVDNYDELVESLASYTAENTEKLTGLPDDVLTRAAESFARDADRFVLVGNDVLDTGQGEEVLNALLNLCTLVNFGSTKAVSASTRRESIVIRRVLMIWGSHLNFCQAINPEKQKS